MAVLACGVILLPGTGLGQTSPAEAVTATELIDRVVANNPRLASFAAQVDAAAARARAAGVWQNPTIAFEREELIEAGLAENFIRLELPLQISGRRTLLVRSAEEGVNAARADAKVGRVALLASAMRTYLRAAALRQQVSVLERSVAALSELSDSVRSRAAAGDASGYDLTRIEVELSSLASQVAEAKREHRVSQLTLGMIAGSPGRRLAAADALSVDTLTAAAPSSANVQDMLGIGAARARVSRRSIAADAAGRGWIPELTLTGGAKTAPRAGDTAWGYVAGVALSVPLFDFGQADKEMSKAALRYAQAELLATEHRVRTRVAVAQEGFNRSLQQAREFEREQLPRLAKLLQRAELSYREGERPVFELLDAYRTDREVRLRHVQLQLAAQLGRIELHEALGGEHGESP